MTWLATHFSLKTSSFATSSSINVCSTYSASKTAPRSWEKEMATSSRFTSWRNGTRMTSISLKPVNPSTIELVPSGDGFVDWSTTNKKPLYNTRGDICGIIGVTRPFSQSNASLQQNHELGASLKLMHQSFHENIAITQLAAAAHLSLSSFQRKFKSCFSMSPKQYMRHLKVQDACHKLTQTTMNFAEISYACGFSDQSHFSREFTRIMKEPPSSYQNRFKVH